MIKFFVVIKKIVLAAILIYSFDVLCASVGFSIPINFFTIILVSLFDIPAMICLILFSLIF